MSQQLRIVRKLETARPGSSAWNQEIVPAFTSMGQLDELNAIERILTLPPRLRPLGQSFDTLIRTHINAVLERVSVPLKVKHQNLRAQQRALITHRDQMAYNPRMDLDKPDIVSRGEATRRLGVDDLTREEFDTHWARRRQQMQDTFAWLDWQAHAPHVRGSQPGAASFKPDSVLRRLGSQYVRPDDPFTFIHQGIPYEITEFNPLAERPVLAVPQALGNDVLLQARIPLNTRSQDAQAILEQLLRPQSGPLTPLPETNVDSFLAGRRMDRRFHLAEFSQDLGIEDILGIYGLKDGRVGSVGRFGQRSLHLPGLVERLAGDAAHVEPEILQQEARYAILDLLSDPGVSFRALSEFEEIVAGKRPGVRGALDRAQGFVRAQRGRPTVSWEALTEQFSNAEQFLENASQGIGSGREAVASVGRETELRRLEAQLQGALPLTEERPRFTPHSAQDLFDATNDAQRALLFHLDRRFQRSTLLTAQLQRLQGVTQSIAQLDDEELTPWLMSHLKGLISTPRLRRILKGTPGEIRVGTLRALYGRHGLLGGTMSGLDPLVQQGLARVREPFRQQLQRLQGMSPGEMADFAAEDVLPHLRGRLRRRIEDARLSELAPLLEEHLYTQMNRAQSPYLVRAFHHLQANLLEGHTGETFDTMLLRLANKLQDRSRLPAEADDITVASLQHVVRQQRIERGIEAVGAGNTRRASRLLSGMEGTDLFRIEGNELVLDMTRRGDLAQVFPWLASAPTERAGEPASIEVWRRCPGAV